MSTGEAAPIAPSMPIRLSQGVFLTFEGTMDNVITLAHELGHAWHSWLLRDLPFEQRGYPKTLAETASLFAEILVRDALLAATDKVEQRRAIAWLDGERAASLFSTSRPVHLRARPGDGAGGGLRGASQMREMMKSAQQQCYG